MFIGTAQDERRCDMDSRKAWQNWKSYNNVGTLPSSEDLAAVGYTTHDAEVLRPLLFEILTTGQKSHCANTILKTIAKKKKTWKTRRPANASVRGKCCLSPLKAGHRLSLAQSLLLQTCHVPSTTTAPRKPHKAGGFRPTSYVFVCFFGSWCRPSPNPRRPRLLLSSFVLGCS